MALVSEAETVPKNVWREIARLEDIIRGHNDRIMTLERNVSDHERQIDDALGDSMPQEASFRGR